VKDKELIKFLNEETDKKKTRMESIYSRAQHSEENKNVCNERQKCVFEEHQRIEDTHLVEARQWEGKVCDKRAKAAAEWRHKMNIKQSVADSRMADIEKSKCERKKNALERKKDQIAESLKELEKMNVTVLGTTGYGSHELANIHRDASKIRFSAYYDPGRDTIDPCRTTQFHSYFKPLHVIHAKYLPGLSPPPRKVDTRPARKVRIKKTPVTIVEEPVSVKSTSTVDSSTSSVPDSLLEELLSDLLQEELEDVVQECLAEEEEGGEEVSEYSSVQRTYVQSNFSLASDQESSTAYGESMDTCGSEFDMDDLVMDVVAKLMACLKGPVDADSVYSGQTSTTDCTTRDGESIVTDIVLRLIATIQHFTRESEMTVSESVQSILSSSVDSCTSRSTLKDLHTRAQFLLNHALDAAKIKLQFRGYNYMTWNVLEDCLKKARSKILRENPSRVEQFTDVELVEWIMEETKVFLQSATALLYEAMHGPGQTPDTKIVEDCYLDQLNKALGSQTFMFEQEEALDDALKTGDVAKFAVLLVQKTLNNAMMGIPRRSSVMLAQALKESNYDLAGSLLSAKAITVAHRRVQLEPAKTSDGAGFRDAYHKGDLETAGTILATRAMQHAMDIHPSESDPLESSISNMVLKNALEQGDLGQASDIIIEQALREALCYANTPTQEISLEDALKFGDLDVAGTIMAVTALGSGLEEVLSADKTMTPSSINLETAMATGDFNKAGVILMSRALRGGFKEIEDTTAMRRESSLLLEDALYTGDLPAAGDIIVKRVLKSGMSEVDEESAAKILCSNSSMILRESLEKGDLETAAPILVNRALWKAMEDGGEVSQTSSEALDEALKTGELDVAGEVLAKRALRSGVDEVSPTPPSKTPSDLILEESLAAGDLETAAGIIMERAFRTSPIPEEPSEMNIPSFMESDQTIPDQPILSDVVVTPVESIQTIKSEEDHKEPEKRFPTLDDGVYFLEQLLLPTHTKTDQLERGQLFSEIRADVACEEMGFILAKDGDEGYTLLGKHLKESSWFGAAEGVVRVLGDAITKATEDYSDTARFVSLLSLFVVDSALAILRDSQPRFQSAAGMGDAVLDHIRETLGSIGIMNETPVASVIGQCHKILMGATESEGQLRNKSSLELMDACRTGNPFRAGEILASKTLRKAEDQLRDIDQFRSTSDILTETPSTTIKPKKSKKKINCDGLPMPSRVSSTSKTSLSKPARSSSSYEPIRDMLLAEEREAHISRIVSTSNTSLPTEGREESQQFARRISDTSLALSEGNLTHGYVRKIQSKEHVYYIDSVGQIKKKAKKKKSSRSRRSLTKDDLNLHRDQEQDDLPSDEPKAISSEVDLVPTPPGNVPSDASRKSIEVRRSSFKRRESNLQMIAVINSSYTNMHRKSGDVSKTVIDQDGGAGSSEDKAKRKSIDEMLSETDRELIKKLSNKSAPGDQSDSEGEEEK